MELSVHEAAERLGVSEATIRRRIRSGEVQAVKRTIPTGYEWRIVITDQPPVISVDQGVIIDDHLAQSPLEAELTGRDQLPTIPVDQGVTNDQQGVTSADQGVVTAVPMAAFDRVVDENQRLQRENVQLAGQVGFLQSELRQAREQIKLLTDSQHTLEQPAPDAAPTLQAAAQPAKRVPWWRRLFAEI